VGYGLGDYETHGDSEVPLRNIDGIWESIDMTNRSWGYSWYDSAWKTPKDILSSLLSVIARGGSYMLNVGPDGQGRIPEAAQLSLLSAGKWIARHPDVVYGTDPSPWDHALPWGDVITKDDKLHLVVYQWPVDGKLWLHGLKNPVKEARVQGGTRKNRLKYTTEGDWTCLEVPFKAPDDPVSVIDLTVVGEPMADTTQFVDPGIGLTLSTMMAKAENCSVKKMAWMDSKFGDWKYAYGVNDWNEDARVTWEFVIKDPGYYQIALKYKGNERKVWKISTDEGRFIQNQQNASAVYTTYPIGWIRFDRPGRHTLQVGMVDGFKETNLIEFSITPVRF
jgi:alpha-L-fucosidase